MKENIPFGNYFNKYTSKNPLAKFFVANYKRNFQRYLHIIDQPKNVLEVGSGEGFLVGYLKEIYPNVQFTASDINWKFVKISAKNQTNANWIVCFGEELPFSRNTFDLVIACEVLEHVSFPELILKELQRVGNKWIILSVPNEPWWRLLNLARIKYIKEMGNTPGHIQHWSLSGFSKFIDNYVNIQDIRSVFPWTFALGKLK